ncbi:MAG: site-2 protease family protein [Candidatus Omnitrophica bacterium]|nr:site-2 protease family protein [Candidatus Omnitrophota bacterium]
MITIFLICILFFSVVLHECAHGWVAWRLGDPTPKLSGRLTLNPISHIDIFGTILLPILLLLMSGGNFTFGYAKPVPINPNNFKNPKKDMMWVGASGPASNLILALLIIIILKVNMITDPVYTVLLYGVFINLILAIFNLLPIPPLDGSRIVASFLSYRQAYRYLKLERFGFLIIALLLIFRILHWFIFPLVQFIFRIFRIDLLLI